MLELFHKKNFSKLSLVEYRELVNSVTLKDRGIYEDLFIIAIHITNRRMDNARRYIKSILKESHLIKSLNARNRSYDGKFYDFLIKAISKLKERSEKNLYASFLKYLTFFSFENSNKIEEYLRKEIESFEYDKKIYSHPVWGYPFIHLWIGDIFEDGGEKKYMEYFNHYFEYYFKYDDIKSILNSAAVILPYKYKAIFLKSLLRKKEDWLKKKNNRDDQISLYSLCEYQSLVGISLEGKKITGNNCLNEKRKFYRKLMSENKNVKEYALFKLMQLGDMNEDYLK